MKQILLFFALFCCWLGFASGQNVYTSKSTNNSYTKFTVSGEGGVVTVHRQEIVGTSSEVKSSLYNLAGLDFSTPAIVVPEGNYWFVPISGKAINVGGRTLEPTCDCKNLTEGSANDCVIRYYGGNIRICDGTLCTCCSLNSLVSGGGLLIFAQSINLK